MTEEEKEQLRQRSKVLAHLLGEAFPDRFTITIAFARDGKGGIAPGSVAEVVANPQSEAEARLTMDIIRLIAT